MDKIFDRLDRRQEFSHIWDTVKDRIKPNRSKFTFCSSSGRSGQNFKSCGKVPYSPLSKTHSSSSGTVYSSPNKPPAPHHYPNEKIQSITRNGTTVTTVRTVIRRIENTGNLRRCESSPTMVRAGTPLRRVQTSGGKMNGFASAKIHPESDSVEFTFPKLAAPPPSTRSRFNLPTLSSTMTAVRTPTPTESNIFSETQMAQLTMTDENRNMKWKYRAVTEFLALEQNSPQEIYFRMQNVYNEDCPPYAMIKRWAAEFSGKGDTFLRTNRSHEYLWRKTSEGSV